MKQQEKQLEMQHISKDFYGTKAIDQADLTAAAGSIHAILGENGAGKTSLMNVLAGIYRPDEGNIFLRGKSFSPESPRDAVEAGIGMVHQHFKLVPSFTVAENITLGATHARFYLNHQTMNREVKALLEKHQSRLNPNTPVWQLSVGEQQRVELYKALYRQADILILDEPTAVLTPQEAQDLFGMLRQLTKQNKTILFITHKLKEVIDIADRVTIMRKGRTEATMSIGETTEEKLAGMMMGDQSDAGTLFQKPKKTRKPEGKKLLIADALSTEHRGHGRSLNQVSFSLHECEILGIAGVSGNGQQELAETLIGTRSALKGSLKLGKTEITHSTPQDRIREGMAYIPADRLGEGLLPDLGAVDNFLLRRYFLPSIKKGCWINQAEASRMTREVIKAFDIKIRHVDDPVKFLSGGNLQRLILGRELNTSPRVIVAANPARGLDIKGVQLVHQILQQQKEKGAGIVLLSEDLDELMQLSDQIAVLYEGQLYPPVPVEEAEISRIGLLMGGAKHQGGYTDEIPAY